MIIDLQVLFSAYASKSAIVAGDSIFTAIRKLEQRTTTNDAKIGITTAQASAIVANTAKIGITTAQASNSCKYC